MAETIEERVERLKLLAAEAKRGVPKITANRAPQLARDIDALLADRDGSADTLMNHMGRITEEMERANKLAAEVERLTGQHANTQNVALDLKGRAESAEEKLSALSRAARALLAACHEDFGVPDEGDEDDEAVGASLEGPCAVQFGHMRALSDALASVDRTVPAEEGKPAELCEDCPPFGYVTDKTRCLPCPRRAAPQPGEIRLRVGVRERFIEHDDRGQVWEVLESILVENGPTLLAEGEGKAVERACVREAAGLSPCGAYCLESMYTRCPGLTRHELAVQDARRERYARIIDPGAFMTIRDIAAARGLDAANPPPGVVVMEEIDTLIPSRQPARDAALAKADLILKDEGAAK